MTPGTLIAGRWRVIEQIGEGGVGAVWRGEHVGIGRPVAIKVLHALFAVQPEFRKRFEREARAASRLSHPACVSVLDFGEFDRQLYLVMEFAAGRLLADRMDEGPLPAGEAVVIARGIATALRHAHSLGIIHRDLKPGNVILLEGGATGVPCKLLDFGLAKHMSGDSGEQLTMTGTVFGTPGYLAPEQALGAHADARSDLYALGILTWEMLVGEKPFTGNDPIEVLRRHIETPAPQVRERAPRVSKALERVISRLLEKDPAARYQTAEEVVEALAAVPESSGLLHTEALEVVAKPGAAEGRAGALRPWQIALGTLGAIGLFVVAALVWRSRGVADQHPEPAPSPFLPAPTAAQAQPAPGGNPALAQRYLARGHEYAVRLWCRDAFGEYERAIAIDPASRTDAQTIEDALHCLSESQRARPLAVRFLAELVGRPAAGRLRQLADTTHSPEVKRAAEEALSRLQ
jgi:serine/threonine-protein kinase